MAEDGRLCKMVAIIKRSNTAVDMMPLDMQMSPAFFHVAKYQLTWARRRMTGFCSQNQQDASIYVALLGIDQTQQFW